MAGRQEAPNFQSQLQIRRRDWSIYKDLSVGEILIPGQVRKPFILGGLGPLAHVEFLKTFLDVNSDAQKDQQHPAHRLESGTSIGDRTEALQKLAEGDDRAYVSVGRQIARYVGDASQQGCDFFVVICNTAHAWKEDLEPYLPIPWVPLMGSAVQQIQEQYPSASRVGILGTNGTMMTGLYTRAVMEAGLTPVNLDRGKDRSMQQKVMDAIYGKPFGVKATGSTVSNEAIQLLTEAADYLVKERGVEVIIGGCTEIPPALNNRYNRVPFIDPVYSLAKRTLQLAMDKDTPLPQLPTI